MCLFVCLFHRHARSHRGPVTYVSVFFPPPIRGGREKDGDQQRTQRNNHFRPARPPLTPINPFLFRRDYGGNEGGMGARSRLRLAVPQRVAGQQQILHKGKHHHKAAPAPPPDNVQGMSCIYRNYGFFYDNFS